MSFLDRLLVQVARTDSWFSLFFSVSTKKSRTQSGLNFKQIRLLITFLLNISRTETVETPESEAIWRSRQGCCFSLAEMPVRAVTTRFMYKGLCTIPDVLTYRTPVSLPEDEVEGELFLVFGCPLRFELVIARKDAREAQRERNQHLGELLPRLNPLESARPCQISKTRVGA